jgi:hypothetical protein
MGRYSLVENNLVVNNITWDGISQYNPGENILVIPFPPNVAPQVGWSYTDQFYPPKPYASWVWNQSTYNWEAPEPYPTDGKEYTWDEITTTWWPVLT